MVSHKVASDNFSVGGKRLTAGHKAYERTPEKEVPIKRTGIVPKKPNIAGGSE